jgi:hypothetical protein
MSLGKIAHGDFAYSVAETELPPAALLVFQALLYFAGFFALFFTLISLLYRVLPEGGLSSVGGAGAREKTPRLFLTEGNKSFALTFGIIFLSYFVYYVIYFPGAASADSINQISQTIGAIPLSGGHPILHTAVIGACIRLAGLFSDDLIFGVAVYSFLQMTALAAVYAYVVRFLAELRLPRWLLLTVFFYYAFFPVNAIYSITMWKDIPFNAALLMIVVSLFDMARDSGRYFKSWRKLLLLALSIFVFCTMRNVGFLLAVFVPLILIANKRHWRKAAAVCVLPLLLVAIYNYAVFDVMEVPESPISETISLPIQQIARAAAEHGEEFSAEEFRTVNEILPAYRLSELYNPRLADPVKYQFDNAAFSENPQRYIGLWFKLSIKYPDSYIKAFISNGYGYWYPDVTHLNTYHVIEQNDLGIRQMTFLPDKVGRAVGHIAEYLLPETPAVSMLYSIGFMAWLCVLSASVVMLRRRGRRYLLPFVLLLCVWMSLLAAPVFAEFRYAYGIVICTPLCVSVALSAGEKKTAC